MESEGAEATRSYEFHFDGFEIGRTLQMGTYTVTEEKILTSALQYDPQPFHTDVEAVKHSIYGGIISNGWMAYSIMMRLMVTGFLGKAANMGSPGVDEVRWVKPVYPGDMLSVSSTCMEARPLQSKPDRGMVVNRWETHNQRGELVCMVMGMGLFGRRPKARLHVIVSQQGDNADVHHRIARRAGRPDRPGGCRE